MANETEPAQEKAQDVKQRRAADYRPEVFSVDSIEEAKGVILLNEGGQSTEDRWARETPYQAGDIIDCLELNESSLVLDYGCGIGRLAKELIERAGCFVVGVDISLEMRVLANSYVSSGNFSAMSREAFLAQVQRGLRIDHAVSVWTLQHCLKPAQDIGLIARGLTPKGRLYVTNTKRLCVPTWSGWSDDGTDVGALLARTFRPLAERSLPGEIFEAVTTQNSFCRVYAQRAGTDR